MDAALLPGDSLVIVNKQTNELAWIDEGRIKIRTRVATGKMKDWTPEGFFTIRGSVRKMRIYNAKPIFKTIPPVLTTLRKFQWS